MGGRGRAVMKDPRGFDTGEELLHESARSRVTRLFQPDGSVIRKEPLGPDADRRLRHEVAILRRLSGVAGVAQLAAAPARPGAILLTDVGGVPLAGTAMPWDAADV